MCFRDLCISNLLKTYSITVIKLMCLKPSCNVVESQQDSTCQTPQMRRRPKFHIFTIILVVVVKVLVVVVVTVIVTLIVIIKVDNSYYLTPSISFTKSANFLSKWGGSFCTNFSLLIFSSLPFVSILLISSFSDRNSLSTIHILCSLIVGVAYELKPEGNEYKQFYFCWTGTDTTKQL